MPTRRATFWLEPAQRELAEAIAAHAELEIASAGSPGRGRASEVAERIGCRNAGDDLRAAVAGAESGEVIVLLSAGDFARSGREEDLRTAHAARARGVTVLTAEPAPVDLADIAPGAVAIPFVAAARLTTSCVEAMERLTSIGPVRFVTVNAWSTHSTGSLASRLFAALDLVHVLLGDPDTISAVASDVDGQDPLRGRRGHVGALLRYAGERCALVGAGDAGPEWSTSAVICGEGGRLRIFDDGFELVGSDGRKLDGLRDPASSRGAVRPDAAAHAIAQGILRTLSGAASALRPIDHSAVLTLCHAAMLSARTRQPESPATVRRMGGIE